MGFFSSYKKSKKLRKLQLIISPPDQTIDDITSNFMSSLKTGRSEKEEALEEYLELCENDEGISAVLSDYEMNRNDLKNIYSQLIANGFGQWIKGHYVALSTIAYHEPLLYFVESTRRNVPLQEIASNLFAYWEGRVKQGALFQSLL